MNELVEIRAIVRMERLARILHALDAHGAPRASVAHVHAVGAGVDPSRAHLSLAEEGGEYMDMARVALICAAERRDEYMELIAQAARTGKRGDGIVSAHPVLSLMKIRTSETGVRALH